jgi:hypothetical protein
MLWHHLFKIGYWNFLVKFQGFRLNVRTRGTESRVPNTSLHVTFLDYDNIVGSFSEEPEQRLIEELRFLQEEFEIGNWHVFWTRDTGRHAICLDALTFRNVKDIVDCSSCDMMFKKAPRISEYRCWVLRTDKKGQRDAPRYLYTVESPFEGNNPQSLPHANTLFDIFGLELVLKNPFTMTGQDGMAREQGYSTSEKHEKANRGD